MFNPFIHLIHNIIFLVNLALLVWIVLGLLIHLDIVNKYNPLVARLYATLSRIFNPLLKPIRKQLDRFLPDLGIDLSAIIFLLLLHFIDNAMYEWFYVI